MKCGQIQKMLPAFQDEGLSKTERALIEKHIAACGSCRAAFEEYQKSRQLIEDLEEVEPPPGFAQEIMARVEEEEKKKTGILQRLFYPLHIKIPIQAVAMVAVAVLAIQAYRSVEPQKPTGPPSGITIVPESKEEVNKMEDLREKSIQPAKKTLPIPEQAAPTVERKAKDTAADSPPMSVPPAETRLKEEKAAASPQIRASPAAPGEAEQTELAAGGKRAKAEVKTAIPVPSPEPPALKKAAEIGFRLQAVDPASAGEKLQALLQEIGGRRIAISRIEEAEIVTAELNPKRLPLLLDLLQSLGEMQEKFRGSEPAAPSVSVRIEIFRK